MKKLLLICSCFLSVLLSAQETDKPYNFPVMPGTEAWAKLKSSQQMDDVCIIPDQVLNSLSTKALLLTCLNYPRIIDFFLMDNLQTGYNFYSKHFNGLSSLVNRNDLNKTLLQTYIDLDLLKSKIAGYDPLLSNLQTGFLELLISQETIINQYNKNEKFILLSQAVNKLEQRQKLGESFYRQITSALIVSRVLYSENIFLSEVDSNGNDVFKVFNTYAFLSDSTIIDKLVNKSKSIKSF